MTFSVRSILYAGLAVLAGALLLYAFLPPAADVDVALVTRGKLEVAVREDGKTRIKERYMVSTPLAGELLRVALHSGDKVQAGKSLLAVIEPGDPSLLDARARAESEARVKASEAKLLHAHAQLERVQASQEFARTQHVRIEKLLSSKTVSQEVFDAAVHELNTTRENVHAGEFAVKIAEFELQQAKAALIRTSGTGAGPQGDNRFEIISPIDGEVLRVIQESAAMLPSGTHLMELGDRGNLEVEVDVLSSDAVLISPGAKMYLEHWGSKVPLLARVRLVEPQGFLKVSALGVEEQRVNVIADFVDPPEVRKRLGDAYRVEARIVIWESEDVLKVNAGACFRHEAGWAVYRINNSCARLTKVEIGHNSGLEVEILGGLNDGDQLVAYPSDQIFDGTRIATTKNRR